MDYPYEYLRKQNTMGDRCLCVCGIYVNPKTRDFVCRHLVEPEIQHRKMMRRVCIQLKEYVVSNITRAGEIERGERNECVFM